MKFARPWILYPATMLVAFAAALQAACGGAPESLDGRTRLSMGACAVSFDDPTALCGTLTVPEDRASPDSRLIGLPFVILPAIDPHPAPDPVVIFTGGPGPSPLALVAAMPGEMLRANPLRARRDVIVMTHRGTSLTQPHNLDCPELELDFAHGQRFASEQALMAAARACRDRLVATGLELPQYTTANIARDMDELRQLLGDKRGFTRWNVVGSSYGSRLALAHLRDAPHAARSVVLDGPLPLQVRLLYSASVLDALSNVMAACRAQPQCGAAFPDLQQRFSAAVMALESLPVPVEGVPVHGHDVLAALGDVLSEPLADYHLVPLFMDLVASGDLAQANQILPFVDRILLAINSRGMHYTVNCIDDAGLTVSGGQGLPADGAGWQEEVRLLAAQSGLRLEVATCPLWTAGAALSADTLRPVRSDVPTLITVGQFDSRTPAVSADALLPDLKTARKVEFVGRGHALLDGDLCMLTMAARFIDDPAAPIDSSCVDRPESLTFTMPAQGAEPVRIIVRHGMTSRSMNAKQDEDEQRRDRGRRPAPGYGRPELP